MGALAADNFNRGNGSAGSNWTAVGSYGVPVIGTNEVPSVGTTFYVAQYNATNAGQDDMYAKAKAKVNTSHFSNAVSLLVRTPNDGTDNSYTGSAPTYDTLGALWAIQRLVNGVATVLATSAQGASLSAGTRTLEMRAIGSTISLIQDGTVLATVTDATHSGSTRRYTGVSVFSDVTGNAALDDFEMGTPKIVGGAFFAVASGTSITPVIPSVAVADDIMVFSAMCNAASTFTTPAGWTLMGTSVNSANQSTAWFWKRHSGSESNPTSTTSATGSTTIGLYGRIYIFNGAVNTGTPFEDVSNDGTPTLTTTPITNSTTTTGADRMVVCLVAADDDNTWTSGMPPAGWSQIGLVTSATGGDGMMDGIYIGAPTATTIGSVNVGVMVGSDYWRTLTFALLPAVSGPPTLVVADGSHAHTADAVTLSPVLIVSDAAHGLTSDNVGLGIPLTVANADHSHTADSLTVSVGLAVANAAHSLTSDTPTLSPFLIVADALHSQTSDNLTLPIGLAVADALHSHSADAITVSVGLQVSDALHSHTADNVTLTTNLIVSNGAHAHTADNIGLGIPLVVADALHSHTAETLSLGVSFTVLDAVHAHTADSPTLVVGLAVANALHAHTADAVSLSFSVVVADALHSLTSDTPTVTVGLQVNDATHGVTSDNVLLLGIGVIPSNSSHALTSDNVTLSTVPSLNIADALHNHSADTPTLGVALIVNSAAHALTSDLVGLGIAITVANAAHAFTSDTPTLSIGLQVNDGAHSHTSDSVVLSSVYVLSVNSALHAHTADGVSLSVVLIVSDAFHSHTAQGILLVTVLIISDGQHSQFAEDLDLVQNYLLLVEDAFHAHEVDNLGLIPGFVPGYTPQADIEHLEATEFFIQQNPEEISFLRRTEVSDGEGGLEFVPAPPVPPQTMRKVKRINEADTIERVTALGQGVIPSFVLISMPDADIEVFDQFILDGRLHEVVSLSNRPKWRIQAEVYAHDGEDTITSDDGTQMDPEHLEFTQFFIDQNPDPIILSRRAITADGEGGVQVAAATQIPQQIMRKVQRVNVGDTVERVTALGQSVIPSYILIAMPNSDIKVFDQFTLDGRLHEVVSISNRPKWRIQAEVYAHAT